MYKYKAVKQLTQLIRDGAIEPDVNIKKALLVYGESLKPRKKINTSWKPRFYNRALTANNRAGKAGATGKLTADDLEEVFTKASGKCQQCNATDHLVFDHIIPMYRGGTNLPTNLQVLCRICNMEKGVN